jgi:hypothetical protein
MVNGSIDAGAEGPWPACRGCRLTGFEVTAGGKTGHPPGDDLLGIFYIPEGYMSAQLAGPTGPMRISRTPVTSHIPGHATSTRPASQWPIILQGAGNTKLAGHHAALAGAFPRPGHADLAGIRIGAGGVTTMTKVSWARQLPR